MMDLARMLASSGQANRPASMLYFEHKGKHIYGTLISHHGYYELYGMPLWVYTEGEGPPEGSYLTYSNRGGPEAMVERQLNLLVFKGPIMVGLQVNYR